MYVIIEPIQSGTFSTVYRAWDRRGQRYVALKVIPAEYYRDEIETMRVLRHRNICPMLDFYGDETNCILVLEYCSLGDLCDFIELSRGRGYSAIDVRQMARQIRSALCYAHSLGIAHRDIKPENILLTADGNVKLADWGHAVQGQWSSDTDVGTDAYRSPETFFGKRYDNFKADYWSFGLTLLYALFGKTPFNCPRNCDGTVDPYPNCCENFASFVQDPHQFMYQFYIKPFVESPDASFTGGSDTLPISEIIHICSAVVENLVNIDARKRNLDEFIRVMERSSSQSTGCAFQSESSIRLPPFLRLKS
ncbi:hypothetical protein HG536_0E01100 [Torulaspora globosa]|uniref:Protein kinase domain-containing protein n=1 Tax=Torulaspora globosa TaxID=48254 RepID=A0A7G3ZI63_9SACH|nr:uncharacterized protein HG536_0E01100 [Torulaspora globosa]QLL33199.1 hypothetical protein HG536_0E01100 [Torulaspora globosa]